MQSTARLSDIDFDSETVKGGEVGLRGDVGAFQFNATAFLYDFQDLQATVSHLVEVRYVSSQAGKMTQRGVEFEPQYDIAPSFEVPGAQHYVRTRFPALSRPHEHRD